MTTRKNKGFQIGLSYAKALDELALRLKYGKNKTGSEVISEALDLLFSKRDSNPKRQKVKPKPQNKEERTREPAVFKMFRVSESHIVDFDQLLPIVKYTEGIDRRTLMEEAIDLLFKKYEKLPNLYLEEKKKQQN